MDPAIIGKVIDHTCSDVIALAAAAINAIPDAETPLLILADRLAELGDEVRERRARRLAKLISHCPYFCDGFGPMSAEATFDVLPEEDVALVSWLSWRWILPKLPSSAVPAIRLAALAPLALNRTAGTGHIIDRADPFEDESWIRQHRRSRSQLDIEIANDARNAAQYLLRGATRLWSVRKGAWRAAALAVDAEQKVAAIEHDGSSHTAPKYARHRMGGIVELVAECDMSRLKPLSGKWFTNGSRERVERPYAPHRRAETERPWTQLERFGVAFAE